ncbi:hypothetical protein SAMN02745165_01656 [Malonomonas rubra DSM 5091]|uniref:Uncharacterized protein n=1 Tax=Malonomonas rubra DSM 5091 TaxID=1122189 RepID=A0A1M6H1Y7_MALRU|nr:hypothetical protein [Malonomonas rubra]SHJ16210.1 hypothetical protein SAMN02745165_01656 [Malonomonas rubra DSM 5091]
MTEIEQEIFEAIEALPAIYGKADRKEKAIAAARQVFENRLGRIQQIFSIDSPLDLDSRLEELNDIVEWIGFSLRKFPHTIKWLCVKVGKGPSEKSRRCSIEVYRGEPGPNPQYTPSIGKSTFITAASIIYSDAEGNAWLPEFVVKEGLEGVKQRAKYRSQQYVRVPVAAPTWPGKEEYLSRLTALLPSQEEIDKKQEKRKVQAEKKRKEDKARLAAQKLELEKKRKLEEQKAAEEKQKKDARRAKMEQVHSVNVTRSYSIQVKDGRYKRWQRCEEEFQDVSLFFSGQRVYIVEENGNETISTRQNVQIQNSAA